MGMSGYTALLLALAVDPFSDIKLNRLVPGEAMKFRGENWVVRLALVSC